MGDARNPFIANLRRPTDQPAADIRCRRRYADDYAAGHRASAAFRLRPGRFGPCASPGRHRPFGYRPNTAHPTVSRRFYPRLFDVSTAWRMSPARDGGVPCCILSYLASRPFLAYLDDDNWWRPDHRRLLRGTLEACSTALVRPPTVAAIDLCRSVGDGRSRARDLSGAVRRLRRSQLLDAEQGDLRQVLPALKLPTAEGASDRREGLQKAVEKHAFCRGHAAGRNSNNCYCWRNAIGRQRGVIGTSYRSERVLTLGIRNLR